MARRWVAGTPNRHSGPEGRSSGSGRRSDANDRLNRKTSCGRDARTTTRDAGAPRAIQKAGANRTPWPGIPPSPTVPHSLGYAQPTSTSLTGRRDARPYNVRPTGLKPWLRWLKGRRPAGPSEPSSIRVAPYASPTPLSFATRSGPGFFQAKPVSSGSHQDQSPRNPGPRPSGLAITQ